MLLGLQRLVQAFRIAAARHHAAGELVDDDDLVVADDVVLVLLEQPVRLQGIVDVVDDGDVLDVVERLALELAGVAQHVLDLLGAFLGEDRRCAASRRSRSPAGCSCMMRASTVLYISERSSSGPEMISGVRASSIRIESTSSTIA